MRPAADQNQTKTLQERKIIGQYLSFHRHKNPQQKISKSNTAMYKKNYTPQNKWDLFQVFKTGSTFGNQLI